MVASLYTTPMYPTDTISPKTEEISRQQQIFLYFSFIFDPFSEIFFKIFA